MLEWPADGGLQIFMCRERGVEIFFSNAVENPPPDRYKRLLPKVTVNFMTASLGKKSPRSYGTTTELVWPVVFVVV